MSDTVKHAIATCDNCQQSADHMWHGFTFGCLGCNARSISRGLAMFEARKKGKQTAKYRELLAEFRVTHDDVVYWLSIDRIGGEHDHIKPRPET